MAPDKQHAHRLLDQLEPGQLAAVQHLLEVMTEPTHVEPLVKSLADAPVEEEQITDETAMAIEQARASLRRGEGVPHEEVLREFGLRP